MIRDTFETNPGLCELFRRKILERARAVRFSKSLIDFDAHLDMQGTYQDNLRIFYRKYPQLTQNSDYLRISSIRQLNGAALEQSWRGYKREHGNPDPTKSDWLKWDSTITEFRPESIEKLESHKREDWVLQDGERILSFPVTTFQSIHKQLTATAGERVARIILHEIGKEIGITQFNHLMPKMPSDSLIETLDHALSIRGWGRVSDLNRTDHGSILTYVCSIKECPLCHKLVSTRPTCDVMRGIIAGWLESFIQKNAESTVETACIAMGSRTCVFRVTFIR